MIRLDPADLAAFAGDFDRTNGKIDAFLPEPGRWERVARDLSALAARWPDPATRPPLYAVPLGVKDVFRAAGLPTRAGSRLPPDLFAGPEASAVARLRAAGAVVLGKTVSTEFAYFAPGPTRNPHAPEHTPGGSSSGSAAAVAAGLSALALGTQTIGSIGRPAAYCGVAGFKPTFGRVPADGLIPLAPSLDHVGLFAPNARAAALAAGVLVPDWKDLEKEGDSEQAGERPLLGVPDGPYLEYADPAGREHFESLCRRLAAAGFRVERKEAFPDFAAVQARHRRIVAAEAARVHADWFTAYPALYAPRTAELIRTGQAVDPSDLARDLEGRFLLRAELTALMDASGIDLWISPSARGEAPAGQASTGDPVMNLPWTHAGLPTLVLPAGRGPGGLPLGIQLAARFGEDERLLGWGLRIESAIETAIEEAPR